MGSMQSPLDQAVEWIAPLLGRTEIVVVGATRGAADEFIRNLPGDGSFGVHRFTVMQLAAALAAPRLADDGLAGATRLATEALAARVVHHSFEQLSYFGPVAKSPGFAGALAATLDDIRLAVLRPRDIQGGPAAADIALLLESYEDELSKAKLVDAAALLGIASAEAHAGTHPLTGLPLLLLDPPVAHHAHREFIDALASQSAGVCSIAWTRADLKDSTALGRMRANLFAASPPEPSSYDDSLQMFSAPGESLECTEIARRILASGLPFDRTAILLRSPERYQSLVEEALRRARIPAYFSRGTARPSPAGRAFLALLACAAEGCPASRFAEYLSLGQIPELDASGAPPRRDVPWLAPDDEMLDGAAGLARDPEEAPRPKAEVATPLAWEKLLVDAAVIGGYERWERRLRGLENEFRIQLESLASEEQSERERLKRDLEKLSSLERFALPLIEDLHALPRSANWGEWLDALSRLATRALADFEPVLQTLGELRPMSDVGPVGLEEVYGALASRLRELRVEPPHRRYGRLFVGGIDEARGRVFDMVFLPGLAEGLFPRRACEDPLLLDGQRRQISTRLKTKDERVADERTLLGKAAASAQSKFIASYPSMDLAQGRPRVPSFYALEVARAIEGRVPMLRDFEKRLAENSEARLAWPAPKEPRHAIDDAEYDMAWIAAHREFGSGRYLLDVNAALGRSLRTRWQRWERKWTAADGFFGAGLPDLKPSVQAYSPSALQHFAACPYRFALSAILRLRERQQASAIEQLDALTRGAMIHEVQREFLREWKASPTAERDQLLERLDRVIARVAGEYEEQIAPAIARVWRLELEDIRTDLRAWVVIWRRELDEWEPLHFELGFGLGEADVAHDPASIAEPVELAGLRARGSMDLVDRHRQRGTLRITDHKTGKAPDRAPAYIAGGAVLQPVLYALGAERMLNATAESGRLFYCTQRGRYVEHEIEIGAKARSYFARAMATIEESVSNGFLPAAPGDGACALCDFAAVCGPHEQIRSKSFKDAEAVEWLEQLRCMP